MKYERSVNVMPDATLPVVLLFLFGRFTGHAVEKKYGSRGSLMLKPRCRQLIWINAFLLMLTILMMTWSTLRQQKSTWPFARLTRGRQYARRLLQFCIIWMRTAFAAKHYA